MKLIKVSFRNLIYWKIDRNCPVTYELKSLPSLLLINPLVYSKLLKRVGLQGAENTFLFVLGNEVVSETKSLIFAVISETLDINSIPFKINPHSVIKADSISLTNDDYIGTLLAFVEKFAFSLRLVSKQVAISPQIVSSESIEINSLPYVSFPEVDSGTSLSFLKKFIWDTAVTWSQIIKADEELSNSTFQIYEKLFLDSIQAFEDYDFKRSLLYSAISAETFLTNKLDSIYESSILNSNSSLRIIADNSTGTIVYKDPIYEFLRSKSKFAEYLHEFPLYLIGKSLKFEDQALYQKLIKLYKTRNHIAHLGEPIEADVKVYEESYQNALEAITCTLSLFKWFGETNNFTVPTLEMIKVKSGRIVERDEVSAQTE